MTLFVNNCKIFLITLEIDKGIIGAHHRTMYCFRFLLAFVDKQIGFVHI